MTTDEVETDDCAFLGGRLTLRQFRRGHRAGTDAVLLAAAAGVKAGDHLLDAGAGTGAAALAVLARAPDVTATLVERDAATADLAGFNLKLNAAAERASVVQADIFDVEACRPVWATGADVVICNPPFFEAEHVRPSGNARRRASHVLERPLADWLRRLSACLRPRGRLVMIHRPEALPRLLAAMDGRLGAVLVRPVHARADRTAVRVIISAVAGSRKPLAIAPPLTLAEDDGTFTPLARQIHEGSAVL